MEENSDLDLILDLIEESNIKNDLFENEIKWLSPKVKKTKKHLQHVVLCSKSFK